MSYNLSELNIVGMKIKEGGVEAVVIGTKERPLLKVDWVGEHAPQSFGRYLFAGITYPLDCDDVPPDEDDRGFPIVFRVEDEWLKRGGGAMVLLYVYRNDDGTLYGSMEIDS